MRNTLGRIATVAATFTVLSASSRQVAPSPAAEHGAVLLQPSDFTYLGYYDVNIATDGLDNPFNQGLAFRYVGGDPRLLFEHLHGSLEEISLGGRRFGETITMDTNVWRYVIDDQGRHVGLWWDAPNQRLWTVSAIDYNTNYEQVEIEIMKLDNRGSVTPVHGPVGLSGVDAKKVYGGVQAVPTWFQRQYNVGPYAVGWGGYSSILCTGPASLGPTMYTLPDPTAYPNKSEIPAAHFRTIMDSSAASCGGDWYGRGAPTTSDRGVSLVTPRNYYDGGAVGVLGGNGSGTTAPKAPPNPAGHWLSPAPDGLGRWVWGDSYYNTGMWIDTPTKQGFVAIASLCSGSCYYAQSTLQATSWAFELDVFDPAKLGEAARGLHPVGNVKPSSILTLSLPGLGGAQPSGGGGGLVSGAVFNPLTGRMYLVSYGASGYKNRIYVFRVNVADVRTIEPRPFSDSR